MNLENEILTMIAELNYHTKLYDEGHPIWSDKEWDEHYFRLKNLEDKTGIIFPTSPTQNIHYQKVSKLEKAQHNHPMLSLDKTKDWDEFINYFEKTDSSKDVVTMLKLDGLTCSLKYENGILVSAETRGNGEIGENILHNAKVINTIPKQIPYTDDLVIDGEVICTIENFAEYRAEYKNPRNFAAGSIRLLDSKECYKRNLSFIAWNVVTPVTNSVIGNFNFISSLGFSVVPWTSSPNLDAKDFLINTADAYGYPIDGIVGRFDDVEFGNSLGSTAHHANAAFAFKFYDEEYSTELIRIDYEPSRNGVLTPVAVFKPIDIDCTTVERASLHNLSIMKDLLGVSKVGQTVFVVKQNMIIPQIVRSISDTGDEEIADLDRCPVCGEPVTIHTSDSGVMELYCDNPDCSGKLINKLDHFCGKQGMDIKGISKATLGKLIDNGWLEDISDIYLLGIHQDEWMKMDGFGEKSVKNILTAINNSRECELEKFITAIGIPLIGLNMAKIIAKHFKTYDDFREAVANDFDFCTLEDFGYAKANAIKEFDYAIADKIYLNYLKIARCQEETTNGLDGMTIVITGKTNIFKNRAELKNEIEKRGGKVTESISAKTNYLINNDKESGSAKNKAAKAKNIPIITEKEFIDNFLI